MSETKYVVVGIINTSNYIPAQRFFSKTQKLIPNIINCKFIYHPAYTRMNLLFIYRRGGNDVCHGHYRLQIACDNDT